MSRQLSDKKPTLAELFILSKNARANGQVKEYQRNKYPKIIIPEEILDIKIFEPQLLNFPIIPEEPKKRVPLPPRIIAEEEETNWTKLFLISLILQIILMYFTLPHHLSDKENTFLNLLIIVPNLLTCYFGYNMLKSWAEDRNKSIKKTNLYEYNKFEERRKTLEAEYQDEILKFNKLLSVYHSEVEEIERKNRNMNQYENKKKFRHDRLKDFFSSACQPHKSKVEYKKGVSENHFYSYLIKHFNGDVLEESYIETDSFKGIPYQPDFTLYDSEFEILIDVEIDEPYIGIDGTPIHFSEGKDEFRDDFFLENNWIVVRFAEIQVIKYPVQCCQLLNDLISMIKSDDNIDLIELQNKVEKFNTWTKEEASRMAYVRFRNKYLPKDLIEDIEEETLELERKFLNSES
jgi:hypothetical protein